MSLSGGPVMGDVRRAIRVGSGSTSATGEPPRVPTSRWIEGFFIFQMLCQVALMVPGVGSVRVAVRVAAFGASIALIFFLPSRYRKHPATWLGFGIAAILALAVFHPLTNTLTAGIAQAFLYIAILAPLWWVSGCRVNENGLRRIVLLLWGFNVLNAVVGVIQVSVPGALTPEVSSVVAGQGDWYVEDMKITLANGARVFRPMGLSDYPGGAASAGFYCVVLGLGLWAGEKNSWMKLAYIGSMPIALFVLYLSQVRSTLVLTGICAAAFMGMMALRGEVQRVMGLGTALVGVVVLSFGWAVLVGGEMVTKRISSLVDDKPGDVYYSNRGHFLEQTLNEHLPKYPLGAGLGRWGMMYYYFADKNDRARGEIWSEIQWTGWILDGGVPLVLLYIGAMAAAFVIAGRVAMDRRAGMLPLMGAMVFAYDVAALAMTFNYPLFIGPSGLEFWILNSALYAAWVGNKRVVYLVSGSEEEMRGLLSGGNSIVPVTRRLSAGRPPRDADDLPPQGVAS